MQFEKLQDFVLHGLAEGLPSHITYHDVEHTKNVMAAAEKLAKLENITGDDLTLVRTAALLHDYGFLKSHVEHERTSCEMARKLLPGYDYSDRQIELVCEMILATRLPQSPKNHLAEVLCDADLYYLGTPDYEKYAEQLFGEFKANGTVTSETEWIARQNNFLKTHTYFTASAKAQLESAKQSNLDALQNRKSHAVQHKNSVSENIQEALLMVAGVIMAGFALKGFLVPNHFFDGGITGISLLVHELYHFNLNIVIFIFNLPLIAVSYLALDGMEVLALYTLKRTSFTITEIILGFNILIFAIAAFKFGIETALYSILTYFAATRSIDYVVEGLQAFTGVTIISGNSDTIKHQIVNELGRGITVYKGERGFLPGKFEVSADCDIIFTVITRLEMRKLKNLVYEIDPNAFVFASTIREASGGVIKRKQAH
ncbi:MAG: DUF2179 domain-containing protein [Flavobacterium sp.]|nr:MAG: DUF2179 domain-containing protein [Flavobacterium sp.]